MKWLYGMEQSACEWYAKLSSSLLQRCFQTSTFHPCVFIHHEEDIIISGYVDDLALFAAPSTNLELRITKPSSEFDLTDLGTVD